MSGDCHTEYILSHDAYHRVPTLFLMGFIKTGLHSLERYSNFGIELPPIDMKNPHLIINDIYPLLTSDRASSFRLKRGRFVDHDEMYSGFFLFRAQKRGMLREK